MKKYLSILIFICLVTELFSANITIQNLNDSGVGSLREGISSALSGDTIRFNPNLISNQSDTLRLFSEIEITKDLVLIGLKTDSTSLVIAPDTNIRIFNVVTPNLELVFDSLTLVHDITPTTVIYGGVIQADVSGDFGLVVNNCSIKNISNPALSNYVGIRITTGNVGHANVFINNSFIEGNYSSAAVEIFHVIETNLSILNSEINQTLDRGINILYTDVVNVNITNSVLSGNENGAIRVIGSESSYIEVDNSIIEKSGSLLGSGGVAIKVDSDGFSKIIVKNNSEFRENKGFSGACISADGIDSSIVEIQNGVHFVDNLSNYGSGIQINSQIRSDVRINNSSFTNNESKYGGATCVGIRSGGFSNINIDNSIFDNNASTTIGGLGGTGGISASGYDSVSINVNKSEFLNNIGYSGGVITIKPYTSVQQENKTNLFIDSCLFLNNIAKENGGAIRSESYSYSETTSCTEIKNSRFIKNTSRNGGGIYIEEKYHSEFSYFDVYNCVFDSNMSNGSDYSTGHGGGIYFIGQSGNVNIDSSVFVNNTSFKHGGAIEVSSYKTDHYETNNALTITNTEFSNNTSTEGKGGAIAVFSDSPNYFHEANLNVFNCTIKNNEAAWNGGGIYIKSSDNVGQIDSSGVNFELDSVVITNNVSSSGGGIEIWSSHKSQSDISNCIIAFNRLSDNSIITDHGGAGINVQSTDSSFFNINSCSIIGNYIVNNQLNGGAIKIGKNWSYNVLKINKSTIANNSALNGGGIYAISSDIDILNSTLSSNNVEDLGSNIYSTSFYDINNVLKSKSSIITSYNNKPNIYHHNTGALSGGYNILSDSIEANLEVGDQVFVDSLCLNLDTLKEVGTFRTVMRPKFGSVAINRGNPLDLSWAQDTILFGGIRDVGASEFNDSNQTLIQGVDTVVCMSVELLGQTYDTSQIVQIIESNVLGCDSLTGYYNLTVQHIDVSESNVNTLLQNYPLLPSGVSFTLFDCLTSNPVGVDVSDPEYALAEGEYFMIIEDNGCIDTSECFFLSKVDIDEYKEVSFALYPNPFTNELIISGNHLSNAQIKLFDIAGRLQEIDMFYQNENALKLNVEGILPGIYFVRIHVLGEEFVYKAVKY